MSDALNDNMSHAARRPADEQGEAALLLVESLIHGLLARSGLSLGEAIDIVQDAIDVQCQIRDGGGAGVPPSSLMRIVESLRTDDLRPA